MVDPLRHTLHLYKTSGATQDLGGTAGVAAAISWSAREPSGPVPGGMTVNLSTGEIRLGVPGRYLFLVSGGIKPGTSPANNNAVMELEIKPRGGSFARVDKGQRSQQLVQTTSYRAMSLSSLVKVRAGDTVRLVIFGDLDGLDVTGFDTFQMQIIGMGDIAP